MFTDLHIPRCKGGKMWGKLPLVLLQLPEMLRFVREAFVVESETPMFENSHNVDGGFH